MLNRCLLLSQRFFSKMAKLLKGIFPSGNFPIVNIPSGNFPIVYILSGNFPIVYIRSGNFPIVYIPSGNFPIVYIPSGKFPKVRVGPLRRLRLQWGPITAARTGWWAERCKFGKMSLGKIPLGSCHLEKSYRGLIFIGFKEYFYRFTIL